MCTMTSSSRSRALVGLKRGTGSRNNMGTAQDTRLPFVKPDNPLWRSELSVRNNPYRYLEHQRGTIGLLKIRINEGRNFKSGERGDSEMKGTISPFVVIRVGDEVVKSSVVHRNRNPSWREKFVVELKKGSIQEGLPVNVVFEVLDSSWKRVGKSTSLGAGSLDILPLLQGSKGSHVINDWVQLSPDGGSLHVMVEYDPVGLEPMAKDVVFFEAFARSQRSLVFPVNEPMEVKAVSGAYLLVGFVSPTNREMFWEEPKEIKLKVHRNTVFVIERRTAGDSLWHKVLDVRDYIATLTPVKWAQKQVDPYMRYLTVAAKPALLTFQVAFGAAKLAARSSIAAATGATSTIFADENQPFSG